MKKKEMEWKKLFNSKIDEHIEDIKKCYKEDNNMDKDAILTKKQLRDMCFTWVNL